MIGINVYDEKKIDTSSDDFKIKIANSVKEMVLRDWNKIVNLEEYQDENTKNFHVDVKIEIWYSPTLLYWLSLKKSEH